MASDFNITVNLPFALPAGTVFEEANIFPTLERAVERIATLAQAKWVEYAMGLPLPDGRSVSPAAPAYARSIAQHKTGLYSYRIEATDPSAERIEYGTPSYDMKKALQTSLKVRINKQGGRYLIIPFRHFTPSSTGAGPRSVMPDHIHALARDLKSSRVTGSYQAPSATGVHDPATHAPAMVTRRTYKWGDRLPAGLASKAKLHHKTDPYSGMVRFDAPDKGHSLFMTFRTMSDRSSGWIRPGKPGMHLARTVAQEFSSVAPEIFREALLNDLHALGLS